MVNGVLSNVPGMFQNTIKFAASRKIRRNFHKNFQIRRGYRPGSRNLNCMGQLRTLTRSLIGSHRRESHSGKTKVSHHGLGCSQKESLESLSATSGLQERIYTELQARYPSYMKRLWF